MTRFNLIDRFRLDHPGREMLMRIDSLPSVHIRAYLNRVLIWPADSDFVSCPTFYWIEFTYHILVGVSLRLENRPSLTGYWKFNTSLLEIPDLQDRLESLIQRALLGAAVKNGWWDSLKYSIRDFAFKYSHQLRLDRAMKARALENRLFREMEAGRRPLSRRSS